MGGFCIEKPVLHGSSDSSTLPALGQAALNRISLVYFLYVSVFPACVPGAQGGQKRSSDPLKLELQMIVSHHLGARN